MLGTVLALTGCSYGHDGGTPSTSHPTSASASASPPNALRTATFTVPKGSDGTDKQVFRVTVTALYRSGPFTRLGFTVGCDRSSTQSCQPNYDWGHEWDAYDGIGLVDGISHKQYLPVRDKDDHVFTSTAHGLDPGESEDGWTVFPAVPDDVTALDVTWPDGGPTMLDVPVGQPRPETQRAEPADFDKPADSTDATGLELPVVDLRLRTVSEGEDRDERKGHVDLTLSADVLFAFGKAELTPKARTVLRRVAREIDEEAAGTVRITGYTDSKGTPKVNNPLSRNRARAVANYVRPLVHRSLQYSVTGKGEAEPIAPNTKPDGSDNPEGRAKNRRVTVAYAKQKPHATSSPTPTQPAQTPAAPKPVTWMTHTDTTTSTYRVTVDGVARHGDLAVLRFGLKCLKAGGSGADNGCWILYDLDASADNRAAGVTLYQAPDKARYYPASDPKGKELSTDVSDTVKVGVEREYWVYFPAPPADVSAIDVALPGGTTVRDVPVA